MENRIVKSIDLSGNDAIAFINSLFRPTAEEISRNKEILNNIDKSVKIIRDGENYSAIIDGLDLSFLKKESEKESRFHVDTPFEVNSYSGFYENSKQEFSNKSSVYESRSLLNIVYSWATKIEFQSWAA